MGMVDPPGRPALHRLPNTSRDVRLVTFRLEGTRATKAKDLVTGMPSNSSGRHSGCRPTLGPDGSMYVATGDIAQARNPQDHTSLGGKVLRIDPETGEGAEGNPFEELQRQRAADLHLRPPQRAGRGLPARTPTRSSPASTGRTSTTRST